MSGSAKAAVLPVPVRLSDQIASGEQMRNGFTLNGRRLFVASAATAWTRLSLSQARRIQQEHCGGGLVIGSISGSQIFLPACDRPRGRSRAAGPWDLAVWKVTA
jgi:hypothetical protein